MSHYHEGARELQDRFDTRRLADRLAERLARTAFTAEDKAFIESRTHVLPRHGRRRRAGPTARTRAALPGFVRVTGADELAFPSYDGNGMFRSLGNVRVNPQVGLLFLDFEQPRRLRVLGRGRRIGRTIRCGRVRGRAAGRARARRAHLPQLPALHPPHAAGRDVGLRAAARVRAAEPAWKQMPAFREVLPGS